MWMLLIVFLIFALLLTMRVGLHLRSGETFSLALAVGPFRYMLFPKKKKKIKPMRSFPREKPPKQKKSQKEKKTLTDAGKEKVDVLFLLGLIRDAAKILIDWIPGVFRIDVKELAVTIASPDAAQTAVEFGAAAGVLRCLIELLDNTQKLRLPSASDRFFLRVDYTSEKPTVRVDICFRLRLLSLIILAIRLLSVYLSFKRKKSTPSKERKESAA